MPLLKAWGTPYLQWAAALALGVVSIAQDRGSAATGPQDRLPEITSSQASATAPTIARADILQFGIYQARVVHTDKSSGTPNGTIDRVYYTFVSATTTVPARQGVRFGYEYRLIGEPDGEFAAVRSITIFPTGGIRNARTGAVSPRSDTTERWRMGDPVLHGYSMDEEWEVVPGTWTLQTWVGEQKLAEMSFTLTAQ